METLQNEASGEPLSQIVSNFIWVKFRDKIYNLKKIDPLRSIFDLYLTSGGKNFKSDFKYTKIRFRRFWTTFEKKIFEKKCFFDPSLTPP